MKKTIVILMSFALLVFLTGCGQKAQEAKDAIDNTKTAAEGMKNLADLGKAMESGSEQDAGKAMEKLAQMGADFEKKEFEKTEAVDAPEKFPKDLIYSGGKITSASDNSSESSIDSDLTIKTLDELSKVKEFYKKALAENGWKITNQQNSGDGASYDAKKGDNETIGAEVTRNQYSNITEIRLNYYKSITQ